MTSSPATLPATSARSRGRWLAALACAVAGAALFQWFGNPNRGYIATDSLFWWWIYQWINPASETQHGWLILALSGGLLVRNLGRYDFGFPLTGAPAGASRGNSSVESPDLLAPIGAMLGGLAVHTIGYAGQQARISILGLLLFVWGVLRLGGGRRWGAAAAFPVAFLVFAIPINVLDSVGFWLRLWVAQVSAGIAHAAHIGVIQNGTQLLAPDGRYNYDVAAACSGVRSLVALAALSLLIGYLNLRSGWLRAVVLLCCFPLVFVGNVLRIVAIVFAAQAGGPRWGDVAHEIMGYVVFVIVLGGVLLIAARLRRLETATASAAAGVSEPGPAGVGLTGSAGSDRRVFAGMAVVVIVAAAVAGWLHHLNARPMRGEAGVALAPDGNNPVELPTFLGRDWVGMPAAISPVEREVLPPDTGFSRSDYVATKDHRHVFLSIVLTGRDRTSIHRPELCLVGQGWTIRGRTGHAFAYPGRPPGGIPATVLRVERRVSGRVVPEVVAYWFVGADCIVPDHWHRLARDAWNRLVHGRADRWAYILMQTDATDGELAALARMQAVLNGTLPVFAPPSASRNP